MAHVYFDEKGPQENFQISNPFNWKEKIKYGNDPMHGYVANAWYISDEKLSGFEREFLELEKNYIKNRQSPVDELKGSTLLGRNFNKFGIASMKEREVDFYIELIKLCKRFDSENMLLSVNKMSIIVNSKLLEWIYVLDEKRIVENPYLLLYTLTKFCDVEAPQVIIENLLSSQVTVKQLLNSIKNEMELIIEKQKNNQRMKDQVSEYKGIVKTIKKNNKYAQNVVKESRFDWNKVKFAIDLWLSEKQAVLGEDSKTIDCHLDKGIPRKYFEDLNFKNVDSDCDSKDVIGIRVADFFIAISGSYIKNLRQDNIYDPKNPDKPKRLNDEWFNFNAKQFELVKLLMNFFFTGNQYSFVVDTYFDNEEFFRAFLTYIDSYSTFEAFKNTSKEIHIQNVFKLYSEFSFERWQMSIPTTATIRKKFGSYRAGVQEGLVRPL